MVIGFFRGLRGEECFLTSMKGILNIFDETRMKKEKSHVIVTLKGRFRIETGYKWNILALLYITDSGIKVSRWGYLDGVCWNIHTSVMLKWIY